MTTDKSRLADVHNTIFFFCCMALNKPSNYTYSSSATVKSGSTSSLFSGLSTYWSIEGKAVNTIFSVSVSVSVSQSLARQSDECGDIVNICCGECFTKSDQAYILAAMLNSIANKLMSLSLANSSPDNQ